MIRILALVILGMPALGLAADANSDHSFFTKAAQGGMAEVADGMLAEQQGNSQAVKDFGAMMVKDHTAANEKLQSVAMAEGVTLPTKSSVAQMATHTKLKALSGEAFDNSYIEGQIKAHQSTVALFKKEISSGVDAQPKSFATETLPTIEAHLKKIRSIASEAGVTGK
jgi:putative membrane protein